MIPQAIDAKKDWLIQNNLRREDSLLLGKFMKV